MSKFKKGDRISLGGEIYEVSREIGDMYVLIPKTLSFSELYCSKSHVDKIAIKQE